VDQSKKQRTAIPTGSVTLERSIISMVCSGSGSEDITVSSCTESGGGPLGKRWTPVQGKAVAAVTLHFITEVMEKQEDMYVIKC